MEAAAAVFAERGYDGARTSVIAERAGLSTGAIYSHYGTKAELMLEALRSFGPGELDRLFAGEIGESESVLDVVEAIVAGLPYRPKELGAMLLEAAMAGRRDPDVAEMISRTTKEREALIRGVAVAAQERGEVDAALSPEALARLSMTLLLGSLVVHGLQLDPPDRDEWADVVGRLVDSFRTTKSTTKPRQSRKG